MQVGLPRKLWVSVSLVSFIPILVLLYYGYIEPMRPWLLATVAAGVFLGWAVIIKAVLGIRRISQRSRNLLMGLGEKAPGEHDEVQTLEKAFNLLSEKVKASLGQLEGFSQKIDGLNQKVSRKVLTLSTLLQANDLFSKDTPAEEVITFLSYHLQQLLESEMCFCLMRREAEAALSLIAANGISQAKAVNFAERRAAELLHLREDMVFDSAHQESHAGDIAAELSVKNIVLLPVVTKAAVAGILAAGNNKDDFSFGKDDYDVLHVFAQNMSLIWNHQELSSKVATLDVFDRLTGLYNERLLRVRLDEEIRRASVYQRPCGFITLELQGYDDYQKQHGSLEAEQLFKEAAAVFKAALNAVDLAGRIGNNTLAAIIIERNKRQSKKVADEINHNLLKLCGEKIQPLFSIAESPLDGMSAQELLDFTGAHKIHGNEV